jgi:hypothetical protein
MIVSAAKNVLGNQSRLNFTDLFLGDVSGVIRDGHGMFSA